MINHFDEDAQAKLAEQLMETEGMLRHRELIISEVAEQLSEEQALKAQAQGILSLVFIFLLLKDAFLTGIASLAELKESHAKQVETVQKQERLIMEMTTSLYLSNQDKDSCILFFTFFIITIDYYNCYEYD